MPQKSPKAIICSNYPNPWVYKPNPGEAEYTVILIRFLIQSSFFPGLGELTQVPVQLTAAAQSPFLPIRDEEFSELVGQ